jgi:box C/D snoRNA protein 1
MDPLLSSLCTICHIDPPKYTCPRCYVNTCSLTCSKRHKLWASCSGVRDPTVFKPMAELATPSGIDHDYNFLHKIEHRLERSAKLLVEDLDALSKDELNRARSGEDEQSWKRSHVKEEKGEVCIARTLRDMKCKVITAPKGMRRNKENTSGWNRKHGTIHWQVEWMRGEPLERTLYRVLGNHAIGTAYDLMCEEERILKLSPEEKRADKKRKAAEFNAVQARKVKKARREKRHMREMSTTTVLQDPEHGTWSLTPAYTPIPEISQEDSPEPEPPIPPRNYHLYLHRPLTPSSFPKVLVALDPDKPLAELLKKREVLEFPTIYVLDDPPEDLPEKFMLETHYLAAMGKAGGEDSDSDVDDSSDEDSSDSSGSDEDSDESVEEGEIL